MNAAAPQLIGLLPEHPSDAGGPLGRHLHFDPRSRAFPVHLSPGTVLQSRLWPRRRQAFRQGQLNTCTGQAVMGLLCTDPYRRPGVPCSETLIRQVYMQATHHDTIIGAWPTKDTGSTVLAALKALRTRRLIKGYQWCFSLEEVLKTLASTGPVAVGVSWYEGFDQPDAQGRVRLAGSVRGGHAFELLGVDVEHQQVLAINSWGPEWGARGRFTLSWADLDRLLHEHGEAATVAVGSQLNLKFKH